MKTTFVKFALMKSVDGVNAQNVNEQPQTLLAQIEFADLKRARRGLYDVTRLLRHDQLNGCTVAQLPKQLVARINKLVGKNHTFDHDNTDFSTNKTNGTDGMMFADLGTAGWLVGYRHTVVIPDKPTADKPTADKPTADK